jgi:hypothetical protein
MNVFEKIMPRSYWAAAALIILTTGAVTVVTSPATPTVGQAVTDLNESPAVQRIGVVTNIVEADNITVRISGSPVLVPASYLFPQYQPVLGDRVALIKQDAQWLVLGTLAGPINTLVLNPSFELGTLGATPTDWSLTVTSSGGGVPTFTKVPIGNFGISGLFSADFGVDSTVAGNSTADAFSNRVPASEGTLWTAAIWLEAAFIDNDATTFSNNGGFSFLDLSIQFLDGAGLVVSDVLVVSAGFSIDLTSPRYMRPAPGVGAIAAPPSTVTARLRLHADFTMSANSFTSFFLDYAILRQL